ncbi:hypothetical protein ACGF5O_09520 [Streptomyces sp. NPDC048291]|uniref:hypothetical protein n=1 Tax=Streptomyces sp. NPDC048291 TaxID=3365530 RepID=UPI003716D467
MREFTDLATLRTTAPDLHPADHAARLAPGTDVHAYVAHLGKALSSPTTGAGRVGDRA